jgi:hypothetical protein
MNQHTAHRQYVRRVLASALAAEPDLFRLARQLQAAQKKEPDACTPGLPTMTANDSDTVANRAGEGKP